MQETREMKGLKWFVRALVSFRRDTTKFLRVFVAAWLPFMFGFSSQNLYIKDNKQTGKGGVVHLKWTYTFAENKLFKNGLYLFLVFPSWTPTYFASLRKYCLLSNPLGKH